MMPRFSLPSEAKTRKAERNEQNPATTPALYRAPSYPRASRRQAPRPASRARFPVQAFASVEMSGTLASASERRYSHCVCRADTEQEYLWRR